VLILAALVLGCGEDPYQPTPDRLVGEFSGGAGQGFGTYELFLALDQVADSVRGLWSLSFQASCAPHDGPFSGVLDGNQLRLRLRPDESYEATLDLTARVMPGDTLLGASLKVVALGQGNIPLCGSNQLAPIALHYGEVDWFPIGR
jgi:hypothetical protein